MKARRLATVALVFASVIVCTAPVAFAQTGMGRRRASRLYNPATVTTIKGTVGEVNTTSGRRGWNGIHLLLKAESGTYDVHLGPSAYLKEKNFKFSKGDQIEVTGSKVKFQNQEAIIAREVKMGGKALILRNAQGIPEWAGGRRWK